jgi:hypothetical protein
MIVLDFPKGRVTAVEEPPSRTRRVLDYLGLYRAGDWVALFLILGLAAFLAALWISRWAA